MHGEFISVIEPYKPPFYTNWFSVCPWNQHVLLFPFFPLWRTKDTSEFCFVLFVFTYLTDQKETGQDVQQWHDTRKMCNFTSMSYCLSSWVGLLPFVCCLFLTVSVWGYLYTSRMEFATKRNISMLFPSLPRSISHLFEVLNTLDSQFSLWWLVVTSSTSVFFSHLLIFIKIASLLPSDLKHH